MRLPACSCRTSTPERLSSDEQTPARLPAHAFVRSESEGPANPVAHLGAIGARWLKVSPRVVTEPLLCQSTSPGPIAGQPDLRKVPPRDWHSLVVRLASQAPAASVPKLDMVTFHCGKTIHQLSGGAVIEVAAGSRASDIGGHGLRLRVSGASRRRRYAGRFNPARSAGGTGSDARSRSSASQRALHAGVEPARA